MKSKSDLHYSGNNSVRFWDRVNALPEDKRRELYSCGVILQEVESKVLKFLSNAESEKNIEVESLLDYLTEKADGNGIVSLRGKQYIIMHR